MIGPGFSQRTADPREPEWAERIISTVADVIYESAPSETENPLLYERLQDEDDVLVLACAMEDQLAEQLCCYLPAIVDRVIDRMQAEQPDPNL